MSTESASVDVSRSEIVPVPGALLVFSNGAPEYAVVEIGRDAEQTWARGNLGRIPIQDSQISDPHCSIRWVEDHFELKDLGSSNGTFLNSNKLTGAARAVHGDVVRVGRTLLLLVADVAPYRGYIEREEHVANGTKRTFVVGPSVRRVLDVAVTARTEKRNLLINGETGVGKELVAARFAEAKSGPFIAANSAALTTNSLPEVSLFGCRKGVGANIAAREGFVMAAHRGVLFLDELAELPLGVQPMLLRAVQENQITVVGDEQPTPVDVQYVTASHQVMAERVRRGEFREDLYFRLSQVQVVLPPLRQRREEIPWLIDLTVQQRAPDLRVHVRAVEWALLRWWPGNVRELVDATLTAITAAREEGVLRFTHFPPNAGLPNSATGPTGGPPPAQPPPSGAGLASGAPPALTSRRDNVSTQPLAPKAPAQPRPEERVPRDRLLQTLESTGWNIAQTARLLSEVRNTVVRLMETYGLERPRGPDGPLNDGDDSNDDAA